MRALLTAVVGSILVIATACGGDSSGTTGNSNGSVPPSSCPAEPCMVGAVCMGPSEPACNGTWYCWSDTNWHCSPPDGGGPGGFPPDATVDGSEPESSAPETGAQETSTSDAPRG